MTKVMTMGREGGGVRRMGGLLAALWLSACATQAAAPREAEEPEVPAPRTAAVTGDQIEAVQRLLRRKEQQVIGCYNSELDRTGNRKLEGELLIAMEITMAGRADQLRVLESTMKSAPFEACVLKAIEGWQFPTLNARLPISHRYVFRTAF